MFDSSLSDSEGLAALDIIRYNNVRGMRGVAKSNWMKRVSVSAVKDYAYIFHCDTIQMCQYAHLHGRNNSFLRAIKYTQEDKVCIRLVC